MNWFNQKVNPSLIGIFFIGLLIGGVAIGIVDAKRPKPLLSKADTEIIDDCSDQVGRLEDYVNTIPSPIPPDGYDIYRSSAINLFNNVVACVNQAVPQHQQEWFTLVREIRQEINDRAPHREELRYNLQIARIDANNAEIDYHRACPETDLNGGSTTIDQTKGEAKNSLNKAGTSNQATSAMTEDCEALRQAALAARDAAERAEVELNDYDDYTLALEDQVNDLNNEWEEFRGAASYTVEYSRDYYQAAFANSSYNGSDPGTGSQHGDAAY